MPGNLNPAVVGSSVVLPNSLYTSLTETLVYPILIQQGYHDNTIERSLVTDTVNSPAPLRAWRFTKRLTVAQFDLLDTFCNVTVSGGLRAFYFYVKPVDFDATGASATGRVTCVFRGAWGQSLGVGLHDVAAIEIIEVA